MKGSLIVPRIDIGQTHLGSLEGKSIITAWNLAPKVNPNARLITSTHFQGTSIPTLVSTSFYSTAPHVPHDPAGTSSHPRM
jgi:hypothetical protein